MLNIVFAWEQAVAKTTESEQGMIASHRFPMYRPKNSLCNIDFILYLLKTKLGKNLLELASPGGAGRNKTLGQSEFARLEISLPPLSEQIKIVEILLTWDKAISTTEKLLINSKQQKKALMQQLLTGKKRFSGFNLTWQKVHFDEVLNIEIGGTPLRTNPLYWDNNKATQNRWISIRDLKQNIITDTKEYLSDLGVKNSNVKRIPAGSVIMSFKLTIGKAAVLGQDCYTNEAIAALLPKEDSRILREYLIQALNVVNYESEIDQAIKGKTLNKEKLKRLKIPLPQVAEQKKISGCLSAIDTQITNLDKQLTQLKQEKKSLMQQLLTGKQRVVIEGGKNG